MKIRVRGVLVLFLIGLVTFSLTACGGGGEPQGTASANSAILAWDPPTTNEDGTPLEDLAGYKVYYGTSSGNYAEVVDVGDVAAYTVSNLSPGSYYFTVTAYNALGNESGYSNEVTKTIPP